MGETIKTLIVSGDNLIVELLKKSIQNYFLEIEIIDKDINSDEIINILLKKKPELLLLDIDFDDKKKVLDVVAEFKDLNIETIIISSNETFAVKAINSHNVSGYIVKPSNILDFKTVTNNVVRKIGINKKELKSIETGLSEELIAISTAKSIEFLAVKNIVYLEADGKYTVFHLKDKEEKIISSKNLGEYEKILPSKMFFRIHHKHIVNIQKVININKADGNYCHLSNGKSLSIAKRRQESLRKFLNL